MNTQFGDLPCGWHISIHQATSIYGDAILALALEAPPSDRLFHEVDLVTRDVHNLEDVFGLVPDVRALLALTGLDSGALMQTLDIPPSVAEGYAHDDAAIPRTAAITLCRTFFWPLGAFFRGRCGYHPVTALRLDLGW